MVGTRLRAKTRVPTVGIPVMTDASTQMELVTKRSSVQVAGCSECPDPSSGALVSACTSCGQVEDLIQQVAQLQQTVNRLRSIRGAELEIDTWLQNHAPVENSTENEAPWTLVTSRSRSPLQPPPSSITTKNKHEALTTMHTQEQGLQEETTPATHSGYHKNKRWVLVVGDSLFRDTEEPICRPDREASKLCCLLRAKVRDMAERVPRLVKSIDYYPLLLFHVGTNDTASQNVGKIKEDFKALGVKAISIGAQLIFPSILPAGGRGSARNRHIMGVSSWLCGWCHCEGFGFYDNGTFFNDYNLLERDGTHL